MAAPQRHVLIRQARVYADVNVLRPREYWDYENLQVACKGAALPAEGRGRLTLGGVTTLARAQGTSRMAMR